MKKQMSSFRNILLILMMILAVSLPMTGCQSGSNQSGSGDSVESSESASDKKDDTDDTDKTEEEKSEEQGGILESGGDIEIEVPEGQGTAGE